MTNAKHTNELVNSKKINTSGAMLMTITEIAAHATH